MGSIIIDKIKVDENKTEKEPINIRNLIRKMTKLSFNADAVYESKDWPYLWPKANSSKSVPEASYTDEELAHRKTRSKRLIKMSLWGILSILMYSAVLLFQESITKYFTRGGFFALAIVATALVFALVHGTFAGHILEELNYKAANRKKDEQ
jgi:hypothetical protein